MIQSLKNIYHLAVAIASNLLFGFPSRKLVLVGVTGTDGKTTTVHLIYQILQAAGKKVAMISSVAARMGEDEIDTGFHVTTPDTFKLQRLLKRIKEQGFNYAVLEVTSHGLDQHRLFGCYFRVAVVTNITHEHLDYHKTFEDYVAAKSKLLKKTDIAILNADDAYYSILKKRIPAGVKTVSYGKKAGDVRLTPSLKGSLSECLSEPYNEYNALAAFAVAKVLNLRKREIDFALKNFPGVRGRMERIPEAKEISVFIDFAHTPNALKEALSALRAKRQNPSRIIAVFGAAGCRDKTKRPLMGRIASLLADEIVLTAEDPRTEKAEDIIEEIASGIDKKQRHKLHKIPQRSRAIEYAIIDLAKPGDTIAVFGKGHEKSMCFGKTEYPWSDQEAINQALAKRRKKQ